ncbi:hypothetical protein [Sandaracinus amylolyticus]|uniref:hypothetical protein n=1 Tax=Sandaracinus amylolyticus TaxID=927083 RepID=UPI001F1E0FE2|nr:hypothetical protein [Sandaracinus amylolyticus]UJR78516.1 Hypothetical protein I5071_5460 [Sandaracinus amylolyticus]
MSWVLFATYHLVSLAVIVGALTQVRPTLPRTGYALASAAAVGLVSAFCRRAVSSIDHDTIFQALEAHMLAISFQLVLERVLVGVLAIAAVALMVREAKRARGAREGTVDRPGV